jgi:hypothetical protein
MPCAALRSASKARVRLTLPVGGRRAASGARRR